MVWDFGMRRMIGVRAPNAAAGALIDGVLGAVSIAGTAVVVYLISWTGWLLHDGGYDRNWAAGQPGSGLLGFMPEALRSLWHYHAEMLNFHTHLTSPHSYQSNAWSWPLQARPTSFYYESFDNGVNGCTADKCSSEVIALGNPIIWWAAIPAVIHQGWRWISQRDWRSGAVVLAVLAGLPGTNDLHLLRDRLRRLPDNGPRAELRDDFGQERCRPKATHDRGSSGWFIPFASSRRLLVLLSHLDCRSNSLLAVANAYVVPDLGLGPSSKTLFKLRFFRCRDPLIAEEK